MFKLILKSSELYQTLKIYFKLEKGILMIFIKFWEI